MTNEEFFDIGRVAYITGNVQEALAAKQALEVVVENANSLQQLKAEIRAQAAVLDRAIDTNNRADMKSVVMWMRERSAV
jgi:hypothetical protein